MNNMQNDDISNTNSFGNLINEFAKYFVQLTFNKFNEYLNGNITHNNDLGKTSTIQSNNINTYSNNIGNLNDDSSNNSISLIKKHKYYKKEDANLAYNHSKELEEIKIKTRKEKIFN